MTTVFGNREECGRVEKFIWDRIIVDWGDFNGLQKFKIEELHTLKSS